jgi:hypothetical protein
MRNGLRRLRRPLRLWWTWIPGLALNVVIWIDFPYSLFIVSSPLLVFVVFSCIFIPIMRRGLQKEASTAYDWQVWALAWTALLIVVPILGFCAVQVFTLAPDTGGWLPSGYSLAAGWMVIAFVLSSILVFHLRRLRQWQWERHHLHPKPHP